MFGTGRAVEVKIYGADFNVLKTFSDLIANEIRKIDGVKNVNSSMEQGNPEIVLEFNREKLTRYGLTVAQVADIIHTSVEGQVASIFREKGEEVDIRVRLQTSNRKNLRDINDIPITSPLGFVFPVRDVATAKYTEGLV